MPDNVHPTAITLLWTCPNSPDYDNLDENKRLSLANSTTLALSASDWRKIKKVLL
jgi:hypothetical protein